MNCPECGELLDHNVCQECDYEHDPGVDCDQQVDEVRDDAVFHFTAINLDEE